MSKEEKHIKVMNLLLQTSDPMVTKFFDIESEELLDEKIEVLQNLIDGKVPAEIPNYYKVMELKPNDSEHWDL